jgi:predicted PurR-regulated permease PerM
MEAAMVSKERPSAALNLIAAAAALALLYVFRAVMWPFALAVVLAILIDALERAIVHLWPKASRWTVRVIAGAVVATLLVLSTLILVHGATQMVAHGPPLLRRLDVLLDQASRRVGLSEPLNLQKLSATVDLGALAKAALVQVQDAVSGMVLTVLFLAFLLASKHALERKVKIFASTMCSNRMMAVLEQTVRGVEAFIRIQTLVGLMIAGPSGLVMALVGVDNALFWTLALFLLCYIPILGVALGSLAPALFALVQFPTVLPAVEIFLAINVIAFAVSSLVLPKMQADAENIDPSASLLAMGLWTTLWGVPGAFLAIPLTLALMYQCSQFESLRWLAVFISNDGQPFPDGADQTGLEGEIAPTSVVHASAGI